MTEDVDALLSREGLSRFRDRVVGLKLASGVSSPDRLRNLAYVQELIKVLGSTLPSPRSSIRARAKYLEVWRAARGVGAGAVRSRDPRAPRQPIARPVD